MVKTVDVGGIKTTYKILHPNKSRSVVILDGLRGDHQALLTLGCTLADLRVIIPDLPGHGSSALFEVPSTERYADRLIGLVPTLKFNGVR